MVLFLIDGNLLLANADFISNASDYTISMRSTDNGGLFVENEFVLTVSNLLLSNNTITENSSTATLIGILTTEQGGNGTFAYELVAGNGDMDNASFTVNTLELLAAAPFDFETKSTYSIRLKSTSSDGFATENIFTINIINQNEVPTAIASSEISLDENLAIGTVITSFSTTDIDAEDTFFYSFIEGTNNNDLFTISGNELLAAGAYNFETTTSLSINIRSTDAGGLNFDETFTLTVNDLNEAPTLIALSDLRIPINASFGYEIGTFSTSDVDAADTFTLQFSSRKWRY